MTIAARIGLPFAVLGAFALAAGLTYPGAEAPVADTHYLPPVPRELTPAQRMDFAQSDVEGCLLEWNEREAGDAHLRVQIFVAMDGVVHASVISGPDHASLRYCIAESFSRVKFPHSRSAFELFVNVHWMNKMLVISPRLGRQLTF